jgi:hypothetical protein
MVLVPQARTGNEGYGFGFLGGSQDYACATGGSISI